MTEDTGDYITRAQRHPGTDRTVLVRELSPRALQENLASAVKHYDGRTIGNMGGARPGDPAGHGSFEEFIYGMGMIGEYDQLRPSGQRVIDAQGNMPSIEDPTDAILTGRAAPGDTVEYMLRRLGEVELDGFSVDEYHPAANLVHLWTDQYKPYFDKIAAQRLTERAQSYEKHKQGVYERDGSSRQLIPYALGTDPMRQVNFVENEVGDVKLVPQIKNALKNLAQRKPLEMPVPQPAR